MVMGSPFLFTADDESITARSDGDVVILAVRGDWGRPLWFASTTAVHKCLAEAPPGLIVDLSALVDPGAASVATWMTAQRVAERMYPKVPLALVVSPEMTLAIRLQRLGARRFLPVYAKLQQAQVALGSRLPLTDRLTLELPASVDPTASAARSLAGDACRAWKLPSLRAQSELVAGELAANAVRHAGPPFLLTVTRRDRSVHIAMYDGDVAPPRLPPVADGGSGGGLASVHAAADFWGSMPSRTGKVVWALVQTAARPDAARFTELR
jgi:hypothetical protein